MILDLFAGPGGWSTGLRLLDVDTSTHELGVEWDAAACDTARAAGHRRVRADVSQIVYTGETPCVGHVASPPCPGFSIAGKGRGRADSLLLIAAVRELVDWATFPYIDVAGVIARLHERMTDDRSLLALEPLRAALAAKPEWLCWEQVPTVLPLWEACAEVLRAVGYDVETGNVQAEQHGVPQTRKRAILRAVRGRPLRPLVATRSRYHQRAPEKLDVGVRSWVSMGDALERDGDWRLRSNYGTGGDPAARGIRTLAQPAPTVTSKVGRNLWQLEGAESVHVTVQEAAVLQSFPADYPWRGTKTEQYRQVGDAVPPVLAAAIVASVMS